MIVAPLLETAVSRFRQGQYDAALESCAQALNIKPLHPEALFTQAVVMMHKGWYAPALQSFLEAIRGGVERPHEAYNNMGNCLRAIQREPEAEQTWRKAIDMMHAAGKEDPNVYNNLATAFINANRAREAEVWTRKCLALDPKNCHASWNLCLALLEQGRYAEAWPLHQHGFWTGGRLNKQYDCGTWRGEKVKRLCIFGEQGQGDEIMFASMIPDVLDRCDELVLDIHPRLQGMFERSFKPYKSFTTRKDPNTSWLEQVWPLDAKIAMGDLGALFRNKLEDFPRVPYLKTNPTFDYGLRQRLAALPDKPRIGIAWEGGTPKSHVNVRTPPFELVEDLIRSFDVNWISCHYRADAQRQIEGLNVEHWQAVIDNLDALTSLVGQLDLVITVDQTLVHQCGAVGVPTIVLLPVQCSWRYPMEIEGEDFRHRMPWYGDHVALLRQKNDGDWQGVFDHLKRCIKDMLNVDLTGIPGAAAPVPRAAE